MTDRERMEALLAGKALVNGYGIHLRMNEDGGLESRYVDRHEDWSDPEWTARENFFGEVSNFCQNGNPISETMKEHGRYNRIAE